MCVDLKYKGSKDELAEITKSIQVKKLSRVGGYYYTPYYSMEVELDRVYYEQSQDEVEEKGYVKSFHAYRAENPIGNYVFLGSRHILYSIIPEYDDLKVFVPAIIEDIVAYDKEQVAGRVMYLFSKKTWKEYQERKPIGISKRKITVETEG